MAETQSSLPSPRSDNEYLIAPEQTRPDSLTPSMDKNGDTASGDEIMKQRRRYFDDGNNEPPRNLDGKFICGHPKRSPECLMLEFDRKCEWL